MNEHKIVTNLFDKAKSLGLVNPITNEGAPTHDMIVVAVLDAYKNGECLYTKANYERMVKLTKAVSKLRIQNMYLLDVKKIIVEANSILLTLK